MYSNAMTVLLAVLGVILLLPGACAIFFASSSDLTRPCSDCGLSAF